MGGSTRLEGDKSERDDARLQYFLGFRSAGEGQVEGSVHSAVRDLLVLNCCQVYKDRAKHLVCDTVDMPYCCDTDNSFLFPEQYKISKVTPRAECGPVDPADVVDAVGMVDMVDAVDPVDPADVVDARDAVSMVDVVDEVGTVDVVDAEVVEMADAVGAAEVADTVKGSLGVWERGIDCL